MMNIMDKFSLEGKIAFVTGAWLFIRRQDRCQWLCV